ncbi:MAG: hypothetical protein IRY99_02745 [Isosphaeraceae bacterium]|nr:hypothetical protein [Isosphaeraceae bacterium]
MPASLSLPLLPWLWAQAGPNPSVVPPAWLEWLYVWGEPSVTDERWFGGPITWLKVVGLFCLLGWTASRILAAFKERRSARAGPFDIAAVAALIGALLAVALQVLQTSKQLPTWQLGGISLVSILAGACGLILFAWVEKALWVDLRRARRTDDRWVLAGIHLALILGLVAGWLRIGYAHRAALAAGDTKLAESYNLLLALNLGGRMAATYMGLVVLAQVAFVLAREVLALRPRRLYAIAWHSWVEAFRRMWAPWVVLVVFGVILAFTDWFLIPPRAAEMGRLYVGTLALLSSLLLTVMVAILAPIGMPTDIQQQTIYTVVSKPVRRLELIWGRLLGYMALVTVLLLAFGAVSLAYLERTVGGTIHALERSAQKAEAEGREEFARQAREQANQLLARWSARVPIKGSLSFVDSRGKPRRRGIDVGQELEFRSFVEGATPSKAIWRYGIVEDPALKGHILDRRIPIDRLLVSDSIEGLENRLYEALDELARARQQSGAATKGERAASGDLAAIQEEINRLRGEIKALRAREATLEQKAKAAEAAKKTAEAQQYRAEALALHSPPIPVEMTFNVYRTTKGEVGELVRADVTVTNPLRPEIRPYRALLPIHEYYTDRIFMPARMLVGSQGFLTIEVKCLNPDQYLGMAESDLYLLARQGRFWDNYLRGLFGIWLQAMVLTAIGVFAGSFLSWPVALLTTIAFFVAGQVAFTFLQQIALQSLQGGGPFESLIRLLSHDNLQTELAPTASVIAAKTFDSLIMPVLSRLVYVVPNFSALDFSNTVADGFAVTWAQAANGLLLGLAYALPFTIAGYLILKNREVAA